MITQEELKDRVDYNEFTGVFTWNRKHKKTSIVVGDEPSYFIDKDGYKRFKIYGKVYISHRLVWLYMTGSHPSGQIDHINHIRDDNRFVNLRDVDDTTNQRNRVRNTNNKSGQTGVCWGTKTNRWRAYIKLDGKTKYLGNFIDYPEAVNARKNAEVLYGFHKNHGKERVNA